MRLLAVEGPRPWPQLRFALGAFAIIALAPAVVANVTHPFWSTGRYQILVTTLVLFAVMVALVRGHRWAWIVWTLLLVGVVIAAMVDTDFGVPFWLNATGVALLVSSPMRRYIWRDR